MLNNFIKFCFFNSKMEKWVTDYINEDEETPFVLTVTGTGDNTCAMAQEKYSFCMSRHLADDAYALLEQAINIIKETHSDHAAIKIMNLALNSKDGFVSGQFELSDKKELD